MNDSSHSPNFTSFLFRFLSPHLTFVAFFGKVAIRSFIQHVLSSSPRIHPLFPCSAQAACLTTPHPSILFLYPLSPSQPLHSPSTPLLRPTLPSLSPTFYLHQTNRMVSPFVIIRPIWCLVPALALPLPRASLCHRPLCSIPLLYISSPPSARPFGVASRHLSRQRDKIGSSADHTTGHFHYCGVIALNLHPVGVEGSFTPLSCQDRHVLHHYPHQMYIESNLARFSGIYNAYLLQYSLNP